MFKKDRDTERYSDSPLRFGGRLVAADCKGRGAREIRLLHTFSSGVEYMRRTRGDARFLVGVTVALIQKHIFSYTSEL
jgi:hypothetical protein